MEAGPHTAPPYSVNVSGQHLIAKALKFPVFLIISRDEVTSIKPFSEFGEWVKYKGVDLHYLNMDPDPNVVPRSQYYGTSSFAYPGSKGNVDPFFFFNNKNPLIATVKTKSSFGATATQQSFEAPAFKFAKKLTIFETKPVKSEIK